MPSNDLTLDERVARALIEEDDRTARLIAQDYGQPPNTQTLSEAKELELWMQVDPTFDPIKAWNEHLLKGTDPWNARTDIAVRMYPNRLGLMKATRPKVKDQIEYANRMAERARVRAEKELADRQATPPYAFNRRPEGPVPLPLPTAPPAPAPEPLTLPPPGPGQAASASPLEAPAQPIPELRGERSQRLEPPPGAEPPY